MVLGVVPPQLQPRDVQLLLQYMENLPWNSMLPLLCDVDLHVVSRAVRISFIACMSRATGKAPISHFNACLIMVCVQLFDPNLF